MHFRKQNVIYLTLFAVTEFSDTNIIIAIGIHFKQDSSLCFSPPIRSYPYLKPRPPPLPLTIRFTTHKQIQQHEYEIIARLQQLIQPKLSCIHPMNQTRARISPNFWNRSHHPTLSKQKLPTKNCQGFPQKMWMLTHSSDLQNISISLGNIRSKSLKKISPANDLLSKLSPMQQCSLIHICTPKKLYKRKLLTVSLFCAQHCCCE